MKTIIYCTIIFSVFINASCNKRIDCKQTIYSFEGNFRASPDLDSIHINDTIWLESTISTKMKNLINNEIVEYVGAENLGTAIGYGELLGGDLLKPGGIAAANDFENILIIGSVVPSAKPDQIREFLFTEERGMYILKLGIVPKKKGTFMISPGNAANVYTHTNKCDKAGFNLIFKETKQHLNLYEQSRPGYVLSGYDIGHLYAFKVY